MVKTRKLLSLLVVLVIAILVVMSMTVFAESNYVIFNFNQIYGNFSAYSGSSQGITFKASGISVSYSGTTTTSSEIYFASNLYVNLKANHIYYVNVVSPNNYLTIQWSPTYVKYTKYRGVLTNTDLTANIFPTLKIYENNYSVNDVGYINIIDLTQMYGAGSEPTLVECESIFTTVYPYTSNSVISSNNFSSYNDGVKSVYESFKYNLNTSQTYNSFESGYQLSYPGGNIHGYATSAPLIYPVYPPTFDDYILQPTYYQIKVDKFGVLKLGTSVALGSTVKVSGLASRDFAVSSTASKINICVLNYQNELLPVYTIDLLAKGSNDNINYVNFNATFVLPFDATNLFFAVNGLNTSTSSTYFYLGDIEVQTENVNFLNMVNSAYDNGFNDGKLNGKNIGYNEGYQAGVDFASDNNFVTLFSSVIEAPVNAILKMFDFDVLGYNMKAFLVGLFSVALTLAIIRLFL